MLKLVCEFWLKMWVKTFWNSSKEDEWPVECPFFVKAIMDQYCTKKRGKQIFNFLQKCLWKIFAGIDEKGKKTCQWLWTYWQFFSIHKTFIFSWHPCGWDFALQLFYYRYILNCENVQLAFSFCKIF